MKHLFKYFFILILLFSGVLVYTSCDDMEKDYDSDLVNYPPITIESFSPKSARPTANVTITGTNFGEYSDAAKVAFNGVLVTAFVSCTDNQMVVKVPEDAGSGVITVSVWTHSQEFADEFTYIIGAKIESVDTERAQVGDVVTINGQNFGDDVGIISVKIGEVDAKVITVTDTEIKFEVPETGSENILLSVGGQEIESVYLLIGDELITGRLIGHSGSWGDDVNTTIDAAVDGDINTFVDGPSSTGYVGYDFGAGKAAILSSVRYVPRASHPQRMKGGEIRGANDPSFIDAVTLHTITEEPAVGVYSDVSISTEESYRYIYYYSADGSCNISELEFYGNIVDAVIPAGKFIFEFDDPTETNYWVGVNDKTPTNVIEDGKLKVTFNAVQFEGTEKRRADLKYVEEGDFPANSPTGKWKYGSEYPILAFKISFTETGAAVPGVGNVKLDRFDNKNNSYLTDFISDNVIYYDISTVITDSQDLASWQLKIADITSDEIGYEVDWIRTFKNVEELSSFLGK